MFAQKPGKGITLEMYIRNTQVNKKKNLKKNVTHSNNLNKNLSPAKKKKKEFVKGAGEMAQRLRALTALPKVLSSIPSNHMVAHNHL